MSAQNDQDTPVTKDDKKAEDLQAGREMLEQIEGHPFWQPDLFVEQELPDDPVLVKVKRKTYITIIALGVAMIFCIAMAVLHIQLAIKPQLVVGRTPSGWIYTSDLKPFKVDADDELNMLKEILETHFMRTDKGRLPVLDEFSTPETLAKMDSMLQRSAPGPYEVRYTVVETRIIDRTEREASLSFRGRLNVVDVKGSAASEMFYGALFRRISPNEKNITGWRLVGIIEATADMFYMQEREAERRKMLGLDDKESADGGK